MAVGIVVALFYSIISMRLYASHRVGMDLAIFDQAVRALSNFHAPTSAMKSPGMNLWGDHFHPALVLVAPFYWVWDDPRMLLIVQGLLIGAAVAIVGIEMARAVGPRVALLAAAGVGLSTAFNPGVQYAAVFDFHEVSLGLPMLAMACRCLLHRQWQGFWWWSCGLLLVKEDMGVLVFGLALVAFVRGARRVGAVLGLLCVVWTVVVLKVFIPTISPSGAWLYESTLPALPGQLSNVHRAFLDGGQLGATLFVLLASGLFLALRSTMTLALVPVLLVRAASGKEAYLVLFNHYNLLPCVVLAFALIEALSRLRHVKALCCLLLAFAAVNLAAGPAVSQGRDSLPPARREAAAAAFRIVPAGASVAADAYLTPHLTKSHPVTQQIRPTKGPSGQTVFLDDLGRPLVAQYRILDRQTKSNGGDPVWVTEALATMLHQRCRTLFDREGYVVLDCG